MIPVVQIKHSVKNQGKLYFGPQIKRKLASLQVIDISVLCVASSLYKTA